MIEAIVQKCETPINLLEGGMCRNSSKNISIVVSNRIINTRINDSKRSSKIGRRRISRSVKMSTMGNSMSKIVADEEECSNSAPQALFPTT